MRSWIYSVGLLLIAGCWVKGAFAGELPEVLKEVLKADTAFHTISCIIDIELDVPGFDMPEKVVALTLEKGKKPKIESKGITFLPRHGIIGQYRDFLQMESQAIPISESGDTIVYKLVSLDKRSDWVTVDITITQSEAKVHSMLIATRKNGEYLVRHIYGPDHEFFPEQTEVSFEAVPMKLPLKFM
ncbi:MAG: hypothetical protein P8100_14845, partial [bacterium]